MSSPIPVPIQGRREAGGNPVARQDAGHAQSCDHQGRLALDGHHLPLAPGEIASSNGLASTPMLLSTSQTSNRSTPASDSISADSSIRTPPGYLSDRRIDHKLILSPEQKAVFSETIETSKRDMKSDMTRLPKSTNMGLGKNGPPAAVIGLGAGQHAGQRANKPAPRPMQPVAENERAVVLTDHERTIRAHDAQVHSWEESETFDRPVAARRPVAQYDADNGDARGYMSHRHHASPSRASAISLSDNKAVFLRVVPSLYTASVANATTFYKDILGFSLLGKPDPSHAALVRSPTVSAKTATQRSGASYLKVAPPDSVQIYLRIAPMNSDGVRERPPPATLWIQVADVDAVYSEIQDKWTRFAPRADEYFPMHSFGDARILSKPQNKAWGNREMHVVDGDENKLIFFREIE